MKLADVPDVRVLALRYLGPIDYWVVEQTFNWEVDIPAWQRRDKEVFMRAMDPLAQFRTPLYFYGKEKEQQQQGVSLPERATTMEQWVNLQNVATHHPSIHEAFASKAVSSLVRRHLLERRFFKNAVHFPQGAHMENSIAALYEFVLEEVFQQAADQQIVFANPVDALIAIRHEMPIALDDHTLVLLSM